MKIKNYIPIGLLAEVTKDCRIINEAIIIAYRIGNYYAIFYQYPTRTRIIQYTNIIEACEDFVKRIKFLNKQYKVKLTIIGENFIKNPNSILIS